MHREQPSRGPYQPKFAGKMSRLISGAAAIAEARGLSRREIAAQTLTMGPMFQELDKIAQPHAYVVMYSVIDKASFQRAEDLLSRLHEQDIRGRPIILVGNKIDLVRSRVVSSQGKRTPPPYVPRMPSFDTRAVAISLLCAETARPFLESRVVRSLYRRSGI